MENIFNDKEVLTAKDLSTYFNVSLPTIYELMKSVGFPLLQIGSRKLVRKDKFFTWLEAQEQKGGDENTQSIDCPSILYANDV